MAEVLIFGSLSGTEPMENMHHTSLAVRVNDNLYVFDAGEGVDLFLMETGHHQIPDICDFVNKHNIKQLVLTHHGRKIINDRPGAYEQLKSCKVPAEIAVDRMTIKL